MSTLRASIADTVAQLPESPGVYLWRDQAGTVLYVGKAGRLRTRVRSYLAIDVHSHSKTAALMRAVASLESIVVPSESHALVLEANLIKEYRPRFNILLRDDKSFPFIKVTVQEAFPRVFVTRRVVEDGARYFGPYTDVGAMRRVLGVVKRIFTVRSCTYDLPREAPERPCLDYFIKRCKAPCVGWQAQDDYRAMIAEVTAFLDGRTEDVARRMRARMAEAAARLDYERAAELRDALAHLDRMEEPTVVMTVTGGDRDALGLARDGDDACVALLRVRGGKLLAREHRYVAHVEDARDGDVIAAYLAGSYLTERDRPTELLVPIAPSDRDALDAELAPTRIQVPARGPRRELVDLAEQNARHLLEEFKLANDETDERAADPVYELGRALSLQRIPRALVCFDISTAQGTDTVGSVVWFENGRPRRSEYRTMRVKSVSGIDDFAAMAEVVQRYFSRRIEEGKPLPDLVVIDGGRGQLSAAEGSLEALQLAELPIVALAKREEDVFMRGSADPVRLPRRSPALRLLQQARDEAHRTAVGYNRTRRRLRTITSQLLEIPGVGPARRRLLLKAFGSLQGVRSASAESIAELPGFSLAAAHRILAALDAGRAAPASSTPKPSGSDSPDAGETSHQ